MNAEVRMAGLWMLQRAPFVTIRLSLREPMMRMAMVSLMVVALVGLLSFVHGTRGEDKPAAPAFDWKSLDVILGTKGELKDEVYTYTLPRNDLNVAVDGMDVPAAAGVSSVFHFFKCSCGKMRIAGQFCCADYEVNDVIDAIRPGALLEVANVGPMFISDKPRVMIVRFQGEGDAETMAKLIKSALGWMGDARNATQPTR